MNHELHDIDVIFYGHWINSWVISVETELLAVWCSQSTTVSEDDFAKSMTKKNSVLELYIPTCPQRTAFSFLGASSGLTTPSSIIMEPSGHDHRLEYDKSLLALAPERPTFLPRV